jgi:hypothetical protein
MAKLGMAVDRRWERLESDPQLSSKWELGILAQASP